MNADGSAPTRLTNNSANDEFPSWAPGPSIIFQSSRDANWEIYSMNADGSGQTNLTNHPFGDSSASWSPDGNKIVFTSARDSPASGGVIVEIYTMNVDGSGQTRVTNNGATEEERHLKAKEGHNGQQGITEGVSQYDNTLRQALGASGAHVVVTQHLQHLAAGHPEDVPAARESDGHGREY